MRRLKFKSKAVVLGTCAALAVAGGAYAYFSGSGAGTGSEGVGTSTPVAISATLSPATLYPGTSSTVTFTVNNTSSQSQHINAITLTGVHACTLGGNWTGSACSAGVEQTACETYETGASDGNTGNFWMPSVTENQNYTANTNNQATTNTGTLTMNNLTSSQDSCKSTTLTLAFTSN